MTRVAIQTFAHLNSKRIPRKMLQELGGISLLEIYLLKMMAARAQTGCDVCLCVCTDHRELVEIARRIGVNVLPMGPGTENAETIEELIEPRLREIVAAQFDSVVIGNACCPFVSVADLVEWVRLAESMKPLQPVYCRRDFLYDKDRKRISGAMCNTKTDEPFYHSCHAFKIVLAKDWGTQREFDGEPFVVPQTPRFLDIDEPADLDLARAAWQGGYGGMKDTVETLSSRAALRRTRAAALNA